MNKKDQLIYSMLLGDGWLCKKDLRIQHSEKQLNYLILFGFVQKDTYRCAYCAMYAKLTGNIPSLFNCIQITCN